VPFRGVLPSDVAERHAIAGLAPNQTKVATTAKRVAASGPALDYPYSLSEPLHRSAISGAASWSHQRRGLVEKAAVTRRQPTAQR